MSEPRDHPVSREEIAVDGDDVDVLLVDDDEAWVASTAEVLEHQREAFAVRTATDLAAASRAFEEFDPDCVVSDYQLERGTGLDLLAEVRDRDPDRPFVLITGQGDESVASDAIGRQVTDYIPKRSLGGRDEVLARRVETAVESYRTRRALDRERRTKTAMLDVLTATTGETELSGQFCSQLVDQRGYACAWIGREDEAGRPVPTGIAGRNAYVETVLGPEGVPPPDEPARRALDRDELVVAAVAGGDVDPAGGPNAPAEDVASEADPGDDGDTTDRDWRATATDCGFERVIAVPVSHDGVRFGVLAVYDADPRVGRRREQTAVAEYADAVGYALNTAEQKRSLMSSHPRSVAVAVADETVALVEIVDALPGTARCEIRSAVPRDDGTTLYVADVEGVSAATLAGTVADIESAEIGDREASDGTVRCELVVTGSTPEDVLATHGAQYERTVVEDGVTTVTVRLADDAEVQTVCESLEATFDGVTVSTIWTDSGESGSATDGDPLAALTDRQRTILRHAFDVGYFERPRGTNATELAEHFGIARATLTQHLRTAERKLVRQSFGTD